MEEEWGVLYNCAIKRGSQQSGGRDESSSHLLYGTKVRRRSGLKESSAGDRKAEKREW